MPKTTKSPTTRKKAQHVPLLKITVQIWTTAARRLEETLRNAGFRRDAYLAKVLEGELDWLDDEVTIANSAAASNFVSTELAKLPRKAVTMRLPQALVERLADICQRKRIVRDAFFNRLFVLLAADPKIVDALYGLEDGWRADLWRHHRDETSAFLDGAVFPLRVAHHPLWAIRMGFEIWNEASGLSEAWTDPESGREVRIMRSTLGTPMPMPSVYATPFLQERKKAGFSFLGMSCYLPDHLVPGSYAKRQDDAFWDELAALVQED